MNDSRAKAQSLSPPSRELEHARQLRSSFHQRYGQQARVCRAPGRVNLIGEHTDYNDGFVMPVAMDLYVWVAVAPRDDTKLQVYSSDFSQGVELDLQNPAPRRQHWADRVRGVAAAMRSAGVAIRGANLYIEGQVPMGAGLGSSGAVGVAVGYALLLASGATLDPIALARICQRAESESSGARCGIMDQFIACCGQAGKALLLDCRTLDYHLLPLFPHTEFVVCNTGVKHDHAAGQYNARRADCEAATHILAGSMPHVRSLRDVSLADLERFSASLPHVLYRRSRHVVSENARVAEARSALERGDAEAFGRLMYDSHRSLRDDYEVSCAELDLLVELASRSKGVCGARMTGGGFGGCTVSLVSREQVEEFAHTVAADYERATGRKPELYTFAAADGVRELRE